MDARASSSEISHDIDGPAIFIVCPATHPGPVAEPEFTCSTIDIAPSEYEPVPALPPGKYLVTVDADGFRLFVSPEFDVKPDKTQKLNIELQVTKPLGLVPAS